jgi:hypothetical protein
MKMRTVINYGAVAYVSGLMQSNVLEGVLSLPQSVNEKTCGKVLPMPPMG